MLLWQGLGNLPVLPLLSTKSELGGCFDPDAKDVFAVNSQALLLWPLRREGANGLPSLLTTVVLEKVNLLGYP